MPLLFPDSLQSPQAVLDQAKNASRDKPHYLVFFASVDPQTGKPWCPGQSAALVKENRSTSRVNADATSLPGPALNPLETARSLPALPLL